MFSKFAFAHWICLFLNNIACTAWLDVAEEKNTGSRRKRAQRKSSKCFENLSGWRNLVAPGHISPWSFDSRNFETSRIHFASLATRRIFYSIPQRFTARSSALVLGFATGRRDRNARNPKKAAFPRVELQSALLQTIKLQSPLREKLSEEASLRYGFVYPVNPTIIRSFDIRSKFYGSGKFT